MNVLNIFWMFFTSAFLECQIWSFWFSWGTSLRFQVIFRPWILLSFRNEESVYSFKKNHTVSNALLAVKLVLTNIKPH